MTSKTYSASMTVTEYTQRIRKALKIYKKANKFMWILSVLLILAFGTYVLIYVLVSHSSNLGQAFVVFFVCCFIALTMWVSYYVSNVYVSPDVELMLESPTQPSRWGNFVGRRRFLPRTMTACTTPQSPATCPSAP